MPKSPGLLRVAVAMLLVGCGGSVATLEFVSVNPPLPRLGEVATVQFKLTDYRGLGLAGQEVTFKLDVANPGVTLSPLSGLSLKGSGIIETQLVVNSRVTSLRVIASAGDKEVSSPAISFAGSDANGRQLTFQCGSLAGEGSGGIHAIGAYDPSRHLIAGVKVNCTAHVADRNGDGLSGASVSFMTEAGTIGPNETTVSDVIGNAEILFKTSLPLPKEVTPGVFTWNPKGRSDGDRNFTGEYLVPLWMEPYKWTANPIATADSNVPPLVLTDLQEPRRPDPIRRRPDLTPYQNNPRDNLVAMIAVTSGEEGFTDSNNNGRFDDGEAFDDLTEPFVDSDDNGTWDTDEKFIDANGNGKWDGKNGAWDKNTLIWVQERILWTGVPSSEDAVLSSTNPVPCIRGVQAGGAGQVQISCFGTTFVDFIVADPWWNSLARNSDGDGCTGESNDVVSVVGGQTGFAFTYPPATKIGFGLTDKLDREPSPMTTPPVPGCFPPPANVCTATGPDCYSFGVPIRCQFTASPIDGHVVMIPHAVFGRIFKNTP